MLRVLAVSEVFPLRNTFLYSQVLGASVLSFTDRWSLEWEIERIIFAGGNWSTWSTLSDSSSIYFGSIMRVLAVLPGAVYSGYSGYCKVSNPDVCTAGAACVLGVLYTAYHVPSTRSIWAYSTVDTPLAALI